MQFGNFMNTYNSFRYFFFSNISFEQFYLHFLVRYKFSSFKDAFQYFDEWMKFFKRRQLHFYQAQYERHLELARKGFCLQNNWSIDRDPDEWETLEWKNWLEESGVSEHF